MSAKILVVDDEYEMEMLIQRQFRKQIHNGELQFYFAHDGLAALETAKNIEALDVLLTDIDMPEMDGITLLGKIAELNPTIQTVVMSGYSDMNNVRAAMNFGAFDFLIKPVDFQVLEITINKTLQKVKDLRDNLLFRQEKEEKLRQAEAKYRSIFENAVEGLFQATEEGRYLSVNPAMARIMGYDAPAEMITKITDISHQVYVNSEVRSQFKSILHQQSEVTGFECQYYRKDGNIIWVSINARLVSGDRTNNVIYYEGSIIDISDRILAQEKLKKANEELESYVESRTADLRRANQQLTQEITGRERVEEELQRSNSLLRAQKEAAQDGILATDEQGRLVSHNRHFCEMWNIPEQFLRQNQGKLLTMLRHQIELPEQLIHAIEIAYDQPDHPNNDQIFLDDDRIFDFYTAPVFSPQQIFYGMVWYFRDVTARVKAEQALQAEKAKTERLIRNVLPERIAERLKQNRVAIADRFDEVTVLFADIVGFTKMSAELPPKELVALLNDVFSAFDELAEKYSLEKIKTIGDAYMLAGGLPTRRAHHAEAVADMALDMLKTISGFRIFNGEPLQMRIGINTGPVVAGVIGTKKFIYDLWGNTVNIASRMESQGLPGHIQVTETTYKKLCNKYTFQERGNILVKGKGEMPTYLLMGRKLDDRVSES